MKSIALSILLLLIGIQLSAQDLIVTNENDSINCRITKLNDNHIYFTFKNGDKYLSTLISVDEVAHYQSGFYSEAQVPENQVIGYGDYPRFRLAINGGFSYLLAGISESIPSDLQDYTRQLKSGYHFGGDISYYFNPTIGIGFKTYVFKTSNSAGVYVDFGDGESEFAVMSDAITTIFAGPTFSTRFLSRKNSNAFIMGLGIGYLSQKNNAVLVNEYEIKGSTLGMTLDFGYDIKMTKNLDLGFQISFLSGSLSKYEVSDGYHTETVELEELEGLGRMDLSVGLRFGK